MPDNPKKKLEKPVRTALGFSLIGFFSKLAHIVSFTRSEHIPVSGPAIIVANHLSTTETLALARLVIGHRRFPHFLAKAEVFTWPVVGWIAKAARQIPVFRTATSAADSLAGASAELDKAHVVVLYPEGRLTRSADLRPGPGKTGAARLALAHPGVPVVPVGQWGARPGKRHIFHRHRVKLVVGKPVDLSGFAGDTGVGAIRDATEAIMAAITAEVVAARGEEFD